MTITMPDPRATDIRLRLDKHFMDDVEVAVATPEPSWWWERYALYGSISILGWGFPVANPNHVPGDTSVSPIIVPYCPEIIDEQTGDLTLEELCAYLDLIEWVCDQHIINWAIEDAEERHDVIVDLLRTEFPDAYDNYEAVMYRAKDRYGLG